MPENLSDTGSWEGVKEFVAPTDAVSQDDADEDARGSTNFAGNFNKRNQSLANRDRYLLQVIRIILEEIKLNITGFPEQIQERQSVSSIGDLARLDKTGNEGKVIGITSGLFALVNAITKATILKEVKNDATWQNNYSGYESGAWRTRLLNTKEASDASLVSLNTSTGEFTVQPGTYLIGATAVGMNVDAHKCRLVSLTGGTTILATGTSCQTITAAAISGQSLTTYSHLFTVQTFNSATLCAFQHYFKDNFSTNFGLGTVNASGGAPTVIDGEELFAMMFLLKLT